MNQENQELNSKNIEHSKDSNENNVESNHKEPLPSNVFEYLVLLSRSLPYPRLAIGIILTLFAFLFFWTLIPEKSKERIVSAIIPSSSSAHVGYYPSVTLGTVKHEIDFTQWVPAPVDANKDSYYKVIWDVTFECKRLWTESAVLATPIGTSGKSPQITSSHELSIIESSVRRIGSPGMRIRKDVLLDITKEDVGRFFDASVKSIRWGGFSDQNAEWTTIEVRHPTKYLEIKLTFSENKKGKEFRVSNAGLADGNNYTTIKNPDIEVKDTQIIWIIPNPKLGNAYRIDWTW